MILATVIQGAAMFVVPTTQGSAFEPWQMVIRVLPSLLLLAGPRIQRLQAQNDSGTFAPRTTRPYSLLPYVSIASTFVAELMVLPAGVNVRLWGVVIGAIVVTLLVVGRQLVAFHDNTALIHSSTPAAPREQERRLSEQACSTTSPGWPTGRCWRPRCPGRSTAPARRPDSRCSSSISTISRRSTTRSDIRPGTCC